MRRESYVRRQNQCKIGTIIRLSKRRFGKLTGDKEIEVEGIVEKGIGKAKELVEDAKTVSKVQCRALKMHLTRKTNNI
jgi:uncharacterized protein YjbJ (UPF0337 family)